MENKKQTRDYDNEPIVIKDRMPEISFIVIMIFIIFAIILINIFITTNENVDILKMIIYFSIMYFPVFYFLKSRIKKHRKIFLYQNEIVREWNDEKLNISLDNVKDVKKSFIDFYSSKQKTLILHKPIIYLLSPLILLIQHPFYIVIKFLYKLFNNFSNKSLFDTIVIFDKNEEMIAIFIATLEEKEELRKYFFQKGFNVDNLSIFYTTDYAIDELTNYFNKKDK